MPSFSKTIRRFQHHVQRKSLESTAAHRCPFGNTRYCCHWFRVPGMAQSASCFLKALGQCCVNMCVYVCMCVCARDQNLSLCFVASVLCMTPQGQIWICFNLEPLGQTILSISTAYVPFSSLLPLSQSILSSWSCAKSIPRCVPFSFRLNTTKSRTDWASDSTANSPVNLLRLFLGTLYFFCLLRVDSDLKKMALQSLLVIYEVSVCLFVCHVQLHWNISVQLEARR